jgi:hypothetical protein
MRKVMVSKFGMPGDQPTERGVALFHEFGTDFEELRDGLARFSTAIVEWPDGRVENVPVSLIRFVDPHEL